MILLVACAAPLPEPPAAATLEEVEVEVGPWRARAASATVEPAKATTGSVSMARSEAPEVDIRADRSTWDLASRQVVLQGAVRVTRGDFVLTCEELEVRYLDADRVDELRAVGAVSITQGARTASAGQAHLVARTGEVVLTGDPRLADGANELTGERIVLYLDQQRVTCEGSAGQACRMRVRGAALPRVAPP